MKRVATAVVLIPLVLLLLFRGPFLLFSAFMLLVAILATLEYEQLLKGLGFGSPKKIAVLITAALLCFGATAGYSGFTDAVIPIVWLLVPFVVLGICLFTMEVKSSFPLACGIVLGIFYVGLPLSLLIEMRTSDFGVYLLFAFLLIIWSGDVAALYIGKTLGRHKLAPSISPGKTVEGSIASLLCAIGIGIATLSYPEPILKILHELYFVGYTHPGTGSTGDLLRISSLKAIIIATVVNVAAQIGDLVESMAKRSADMKDSGSILPGHGGILDRIDSLLFAAPFMWVVVALLRF